MNSTKLTQVHVYIIGGVLMLLLGVGLFFALIKPLNDSNTLLQASIGSTEATPVSIDSRNFNIAPNWESQKKAAEEKLEEAKQREASKRAQLTALENRKQVPGSRRIDVGDGSQAHLLRVTMPRWLTLPQYVVQNMNAYARSTAARHRVRVQTEFKAPAPSTDPTQIPTQIIAWNLGPMTMTGEFNQVMRWVEDWNRAPLLVAVDGLRCSLAGKGGRVEATANLTVYVFPTGEAVTNPAAAPGGGAPGAAGGYPGGAGGYPGGAGGYPGMGGGSGYPGGPPAGYPGT